MGILDTVLGRNFPTKKFENLLYEAIAELKYSMPSFGEEISSATSCVSRFLKDEKKHDKAYRKVNIVIKKQNHLDACNIIIGYLSLLIDNIDSFKAKTDIPVEHLEAVSGVIFAAPRIKVSSCFTAIQDVRKILLSHFGQNLVVQYLERNNCGINPQIIEKLSKKPSLREVRMKLLEEIAAKENIVLKLEEASTSTEGRSDKANKVASEEIVEDETRKGCEISDPSGKKKQIDVADAYKAVGNLSNSPGNEQPEQEIKGNDDGSAKRGNMKQKGKEKQIDATEKALGNSSNGPGNKESEQKQKGNEDGLAKERKKKETDVAGKALGSSSTSRENKKSEQKGNGDSSAKRGTKQKGKDKQADVAEKALGSSSNGPENKKSEQKGNEDGTAKEGKKKHTDVVGKSLGSPSNDPEKEKSEQECNDVTSESERRVVSDLEEDIKLDENFVELLEKDIEINWSVGDLEDVDHMVQLVGETADLRRPLSVRTRRVPEQ
ncbi:hypothetical protein Bca4012_053829 [Brassica carinata]